MGKFKVYLIPNTHSDLQYLKSYKEYLPLHLSNLKEGLNILGEYPEYCYVTEHIALLEEFWERSPDYREKIKRFAQEGRLEMRSNAYSICDTNIPCGESLIQQFYFGKRWTKRYLGIESKTAWMADSFGHNAQMPQILKGCGYIYFIFDRGIDNPNRKSEFWWQGLDNTKILACWPIYGYGGIGHFSPDEEKDFIKLRRVIEELKKHSPSSKLLLGNGGDFVRPSRFSCKRVKNWNKLNKEEIIFSTPSKYFTDLLKENPKLEIFKGELNPVFQGCYSNRIEIKQKNRFLENKILTLEKISILTSLFSNFYPFKDLERAWKKLLFYQFHDSISGTIVDSAYEEVLNGYKEVDEILNKVFQKNLNFLKDKIQGKKETSKIMIFNPLSWERKDLVKIKGGNLQIQDEEGNLINSQEIKEDNSSFLIFTSSIPSFGYKIFSLNYRKNNPSNTFKIKDNQIENKFYKIKLGNNGVINSLISKENNFEYVDQGRAFFNDLVMQDDNGDLWLLYEGPLVDSHSWGRAQDNIKDPLPDKPKFSKSGKRRIGFFVHSKDGPNKVEIIEKGPVRVTIKVEGILSFWEVKVKFIQYIYLYSELNRIDFKTKILPSGKHYRIRVCFPTSIRNGKIYHGIPFGSIEREEGEFPAQNWIAYGNEERGICLLNQGLPGNNVTEGVMMLSLMRSVAMEYKGPSKGAFEEGIFHTFNYSIVPYSKRSFSSFTKRGWEFNSPLISLELNSIKERLPLEKSFIKLQPSNIVLSGLRRVENGILMRLYEAEGKECKAKIEFFKELKEVEETDFLGRGKRKIEKVKENMIESAFSPYQIKTFELEL